MITNSHIHTFISQDIPDKFLPFKLVRWLAKKDRKAFNFILHYLNPFTKKDVLDKYLQFIRTGKNKSQKNVLKEITPNYPQDTRYIILPMDMAYMGAGKVPRAYTEQLNELAELDDKRLIKFLAVDPRRDRIDSIVHLYTERFNFKGIKLYPPLGYYPYDTRLFDIYEFCQQAKLSVIAHGSPNGPVHFKGSYNELYDLLGVRKDARRALRHLDKKQLCRFFTDPVNYSIILSKFPKLHICLAHFGGQDWARYLNNDKIDNWVSVLLSMIDKFDNLYTDISYTMSNEDYWPIFKLMLIDNPKLRQRVLFGSDFYMNEVEGEEKVWSIKFRVFLGEELFTQIAVTNPKVFLHEQSEV